MPIPTDPVLAQQWHLINTAPGLLDLNVSGVWNPSEGLAYTGAGTRTVVIDDGFDYTNPDFDNYNTGIDYNYADGNADPIGVNGDNHGTAVAGIIGAAADGSGAVGVAFGTELVGFRTLGLISNAWLGNIRDTIFDAAAIADQVNISQGIANAATSVFRNGYDATLFAAIESSIGTAVSSGRGGLGTTIVKSAGNSRGTNYDVNADDWTNDTRQVVVAAVNQNGSVSSYSSFGAAVLVSAFGTPGEVVTTDRTGADGYAAGDITTTFNGTSAAAPMVTGVVALMNEANSGLGWRDIQSILSVSARQVGSEVGAGIVGSERYAWGFSGGTTWNGGGRHFSNDYGFGLVDATAAVRLAESWLLTGTAAATSANEVSNTIAVMSTPTVIPDGSLTGTSFSASNAVDDVVERVTVTMNFATSYVGDVRIYLTSPSGTTSELLAGRLTGTPGGVDFNGTYTFESQAFRGESTAGTWTVRVVDDESIDSLTVNSISINTYSEDTVDQRYIFTNEYSDYAGLFGHTTNISDTDGGEDTVNASAVTSGSTIYLDAVNPSTIDGIATTFANIENAIGGDGGDVIVGNSGANKLFGQRGTDELAGADGNDQLYGGAGNDFLDGGADVDTMTGGTGNDVYYVDNAADIIVESAGEDVGGDTVYSKVTFALAADDDIETLLVFDNLSTDAIDLTGNDLGQDVFGNNGANVLSGLGGSDALYGMFGADTLNGGTGADYMNGGDDNDTYFVDNAGDVIIEEYNLGFADRVLASISFTLAADDDIEQLATTFAAGTGAINLTGNDLAQTINGNAGANVLTGLGGADVLKGFGGADTLDGGAGADSLDGGTGVDTMNGGADNDTYTVDDASDVIVEIGGGGTEDRVNASVTFALAGDDDIEILATTAAAGTAAISLTGNNLVQAINGNAGANLLSGLGGADTLSGFAGADTLDGGTGADTLIGGADSDTYVVDNTSDIIVENVGGGTADQVLASITFVLAGDDDIEILRTTSDAGTDAITLIGNNRAQAITGNAGENDLIGLGGNDRLEGLGGTDLLLGGTGSDVLDGGTGADTLSGGADSDVYFVDNVGDAIIENAGGGTFDQLLTSISFGLAADDDIERLTTTFAAGTGAINLTGNDLAQVVTGNAGANVLSGLGGADDIYGLEGIDTLDGGAGADTLNGGADNDTYIVDNAGDVIIEFAGNGTADRVLASVNFVLASGEDIETLATTLAAGTGAINLTGNDLAQTINGNAGANVLTGLGGVDVINGLGGTDTLDGGAGADMLDGGTGADTMTGGADNDFYYVDNLGDVVVEIAGGGTADRVLASASFVLAADDDIELLTTTLAAGTGAINLTGNDLVQTITGNAGVNVLGGLGGADVLNGLAGADTLDGGTGADTMNGGADNDLYFVDNLGDIIVEGVGGGASDEVRSSITFALAADDNIEFLRTLSDAGTDPINLTGNDVAQTITGNAGVNVLKGLGGADVLNGLAGTDTLDGGTGADTMTGGADSDFYFVDNAGDVIVESAGGGTADRVAASINFALAADDDIEQLTTTFAAGNGAINLTGNDLVQAINGNAGANVLSGLGGADVLNGLDGADTLIGGSGFDTLTGGGAADQFRFGAAVAGNGDRITDFAVAVDKLVFTAAEYGLLAGGPLGAANFTAGAAAVGVAAQFVYNNVAKTLSWDADGSGLGSAVLVATFDTAVALTTADFVLV